MARSLNLWMMIGALVVVGLGITAYAQRAECAFCFTGTCFNSSTCGRGCVCLKQGLDTSGQCFSID